MTRVERVVLRDETLLRLGGYGDNFHTTWTDDGQLVALCDGAGFRGASDWTKFYNSRLFAMRGTPPDVTFGDVPGYPELVTNALDRDPHRAQFYSFATISIEGEIFQFLSTPYQDDGPEPTLRFSGAKLISSPDGGATWRNQDGSTPVRWEDRGERSRDTMVFWMEPQESFALLSVLQMGQEYRLNTDGFVYVYAPNGLVDGEMNELVMFRVPKDRVLDRGAYEYFAGLDAAGAARWSADIADRRPLHVFPTGWVTARDHPYSWMPSVTYDAPLGLYLMASWGTPASDDGTWFTAPSYLGIWTAETPWGPWTQIHEDVSWMPGGDERARCYQPQIPPMWIADDGLSFWLLWTDYQPGLPAGVVEGTYREIARTAETLAEWVERTSGIMPYYGVNVQRVELVLAPGGTG
jgi:hypothetical protein